MRPSEEVGRVEGARVLLGSRSTMSPGAAAFEVGRCVVRTMLLLARRQIRQPHRNLGLVVPFADGTSAAIYRETTLVRARARDPAFLAVCFRLRGLGSGTWGHALFRAESLLNTVLFAGFPGLVSKLWLRHDEHDVYRGLYEWDGADLALHYVDALWWVLALVSVPGTIKFAIVPGVERDRVLAGPSVLDRLPEEPTGWWRPVALRRPRDPGRGELR